MTFFINAIHARLKNVIPEAIINVINDEIHTSSHRNVVAENYIIEYVSRKFTNEINTLLL